ncbi:alphaherpesvirus glycoprotein E domain-containing protein [Purpureocillium lilacinum]|uniref:Alphaherpesvirus glycoprotein E domain-containing protein n=1 Tax=Purpureocillium lilacinum TaxID=33203 RepID=A0A179HHY8_PURLI|nr:alphaherpesvirus glycoprotein E domain-containing protein [Purpureocillium lilacinum]OAQ89093.1 alphaherpesvirus glycoprotein E domain-containing protein [Purpureocillium lilacinum]
MAIVEWATTSVSPTPTPTPTPLSTPSASTAPSAGAIAGSVIGGVAFVLLVSAAAFLFLRRRRRRHQLRRQNRTPAELTDKTSPRSELETKERPQELVAPAQVSGGMYEMPG